MFFFPPSLPASDWSVVRIYPRFLRLIGGRHCTEPAEQRAQRLDRGAPFGARSAARKTGRRHQSGNGLLWEMQGPRSAGAGASSAEARLFSRRDDWARQEDEPAIGPLREKEAR
eukprot:677419-Prorocentrum_minimum.AAC.2